MILDIKQVPTGTEVYFYHLSLNTTFTKVRGYKSIRKGIIHKGTLFRLLQDGRLGSFYCTWQLCRFFITDNEQEAKDSFRKKKQELIKSIDLKIEQLHNLKKEI